LLAGFDSTPDSVEINIDSSILNVIPDLFDGSFIAPPVGKKNTRIFIPGEILEHHRFVRPTKIPASILVHIYSLAHVTRLIFIGLQHNSKPSQHLPRHHFMGNNPSPSNSAQIIWAQEAFIVPFAQLLNPSRRPAFNK